MRLLLSVLLLVPGLAVAQDAKPQDDIVVRAQREKARKEAATFVTNISRSTDGQLARYHQPVCVAVIGGLPPEHVAIVEARIREVAAAAGIAIAKKTPCTANFIVAIAVNGSDLVKDMAKARPDWLTGLSSSDIKVLTTPGPARAWSITSLRNESGEMLSSPRMSDAFTSILPQGRSALENGGTTRSQAEIDAPSLRVQSSSIVARPNRQDIEASFVVIDRPAIVGLSLRQIADYAAMRGLGHTRPPAPGGPIETILTVLDGAGTPPRALTDSDAAYLKALYSTDGRRAAVTERNAIARRIADGK
ncbi:hypothetical protein FPZ24_06865 [Sphingomonas panacisoli]|uniref:DUF2927 domain-containing protein n=1 Tax=Sphingomonas panacisoli TaxID=1813879 RepID=A0A5B8LH50_9SPHN|nr:hypothetical protein [Sphingomonas panacisoli]QDZ07236.1 hypothetical protein FPZ24_06865 [Sphingomonas panacisoli]